MDFLQKQVVKEERPCCLIGSVKEEEDEERVAISGQLDRGSVKEEPQTPSIKREGEDWGSRVKDAEPGAESPAEIQIEVNVEPESESEESSEKRPGSQSRGRKRAQHLRQPHRKVLELTDADFEIFRSMTGTPISYLANQPPLLIALGENTYPLGSGLSYQIPSMSMFYSPQDDES